MFLTKIQAQAIYDAFVVLEKVSSAYVCTIKVPMHISEDDMEFVIADWNLYDEFSIKIGYTDKKEKFIGLEGLYKAYGLTGKEI